jgi:Protein of unknown function (DUF3037)
VKPELSYRYTVLRYEHDVRTEEFLNVGVLFWVPEQSRLFFLCAEKAKRLASAFPGIEADQLTRSLKALKSRFESLEPKSGDDVLSIAQRVVPSDDSSLQWSTPRAGFAENPKAALERVFHCMVTKYDQKREKHVRSDQDLWHEFERRLRAHNVLHVLHPTTIRSPIREYHFNHSWRNGRPHILVPVSLDAETRESVADKATKWVGQIMDLSRSSDSFKLNLVLGEPTAPDFGSEYRSAIELLESGRDKSRMQIIPQAKIDQFAETVAEEIRAQTRTR